MRLYLAGPMRKIAQFNFPAFDAGTSTLEALGHDVFNPADRDRGTGFTAEGMTGHEDLAELGFSLREALAADTWWISRNAEAVALLPGWQKSSGVAAEIALANALGLPVANLQDFDESGPFNVLEFDREPSGSVGPTYPWPTDPLESPVHSELPAFFAPNPQPLGISFTNSTNEVRTTSSTGGEKGTKPERYDLIPVGALAKVAQLYGQGALKYQAHNWRRGYEWSKSYAALQRHATQFWNGEDNDAEMGLPHMASVAFHALALLTFMEEQPGFDDRFKAAPEECCGENAACSNCYKNDLGASA